MLRCILCGGSFLSTIYDPADGERHEMLTCGAHSDEELSDRGLDDLWISRDPDRSPAYFAGGRGRVVAAWDQDPEYGGYGTYALLDDGDLLMFVCWGWSAVAVARVPRAARMLEEPVGLVPCQREPWLTAIRDGWIVEAVRSLPDDNVQVEFAGHGALRFGTQPMSWRELGDLRFFLEEQWRPAV
jgi:hypothetical protein